MSITYGSIADAVASSVQAATVAWPPGLVEGDGVLLFFANKDAVIDPVATPTVETPGFTLLGTEVAGIGAALGDQGPVRITVFTYPATGSETGVIDVNCAFTGSQAYIVRAVRYAKTGTGFSIAHATGIQQPGTPVLVWNVTFGSDPGLTAGDVALVFGAVNSNTQNSQPVTFDLTAAGATFGTDVIRSFTQTSLGMDMMLFFTEHPITSGTASAAANYTITLQPGSASAYAPTGPLLLVRLRETGLPPSITTNPSAQTVMSPSAATFTGAFSGTASSATPKRKVGGAGAAVDVVGGTNGSNLGTGTLSYTTGATSVTGGDHNSGDTYGFLLQPGGVETTYAALTVDPVPVFTGTIPSKSGTNGSAFVWGTPSAASYFTNATSYSTTPALTLGLSINSGTGTITGTLSSVGSWTGVITGTNAGGSVSSNSFTITSAAPIACDFVGSVSPINFVGAAEAAPFRRILSPQIVNTVNGVVYASQTGATAHVYSLAGALVATLTGQTTDAGGIMTLQHASFVLGTEYRVIGVLADGVTEFYGRKAAEA